jgi:hypothetical protein
MRLARTASPLPRKSGRQDSNLRSPAPEAGGVAASPTARSKEVGRRDLLPSTGAARCSNAFRCHSLPVGTPASHRRGPPGRCPLPLATPNARYGPRTARASAVVPSLPWAIRRRPNPTSTPGGTRTRASGLRARRHLPFDHGGVSSGGRNRTCASRVTVARLTARPHRINGGSRTRTCERH